MDELLMALSALYARRVTHSRSPAETLRHARKVAAWVERSSTSQDLDDMLCQRAAKLSERWVRLWGQGGDCYDRAVAALWWLAWQGVKVDVVIGIRKSKQGEWEGHAWIEDTHGGVYLMKEGAGYKEVERG